MGPNTAMAVAQLGANQLNLMGSPHLLLPSPTTLINQQISVSPNSSDVNFLQNEFVFFWGGIFLYYIHPPPLRFHCADGCWDRTQDRCNWCIGSQTL